MAPRIHATPSAASKREKPSHAEVALGSRIMRINGVWYDTTGFDHPGGPVALSLGYGRDATLLFRSCHSLVSPVLLDTAMRRLKVSQKRQAQLEAEHAALVASESNGFELRGGTNTSCAPAAEDPFEVEVVTAVRQYFEQEAARRGVSLRTALKATPQRWLEILILTLAFLASAAALVAGWWPALLLTPTVTWIWMVNFWHDAAHFAMSADWHVNAALTYAAPWFSSPLIWYHQHVIGHHCYTNVERRDPDLYHAPAFWRFQRNHRWRPMHGWQTMTTPLLWTLSVWTLLVLKPLATLYAGVLNRAVTLMTLPRWRIIAHLAGRLFVLATLHVWPWYAFPNEPMKALTFAVVPIGVFSLWFMACSQVNHHAEELSHAADKRWYRHQVSLCLSAWYDDALKALRPPSYTPIYGWIFTWRPMSVCSRPYFVGYDVAHDCPKVVACVLALWWTQSSDRTPLIPYSESLPPSCAAGVFTAAFLPHKQRRIDHMRVPCSHAFAAHHTGSRGQT